MPRGRAVTGTMKRGTILRRQTRDPEYKHFAPPAVMTQNMTSWVLSGLIETLASARRSASRLISEDLSALDRPITAISGRDGAGQALNDGTLERNSEGRPRERHARGDRRQVALTV